MQFKNIWNLPLQKKSQGSSGDPEGVPSLLKEKQLIQLWVEAREVFPDWLAGWAGRLW